MSSPAWRRLRARRQPRPTVVLADLGAYSHFAFALRARGVRVERMTVPAADRGERLRRVVQRLLYARIHETLETDATGREIAVTDTTPLAGVAALEADDPAGDAIVRTLGEWPGAARSPFVELLFDKLAMTRFAADHDVPVPTTWDGVEDATGEAVVVKRKVGYGGKAVRIAHGADELREAAADLGPADEMFVQAFVPGELVHAVGVARNGEMLQQAAYRSQPAAGDPTGPPAEVVIVDAPDVDDVARRHVQALKYTGAFCIDYVQPTGGAPLFIDFNPRIWSSWSSVELAGLRIVDAYLEAHDLTDGGHRSARGRAVVGRRHSAKDPFRPIDGVRGIARVRQVTRQIVLAVRVLGWRWLVIAGGDRLLRLRPRRG